MARPRCSYIPQNSVLRHLANVKALEDMCLVTEVFSCPAYSFYLSNKSECPCTRPEPIIHVWLIYRLGEEVVNLALVGSFPVPQAPVVTAGGDVEGKWWVQNTSGLFRSARNPDGKDDYTPLYMLKNIRKKTFFSRRGEKPPERQGDDL